MPTEFDDSQHYGLFLTNPNVLDSNTAKRVRHSELTIAALRAGGILDNVIDGMSPPALDKLWLDKNFDPAVLKEWDSIGSNWEPVTFKRMFERASITSLALTGGTANALTVAQPANFIPSRLYSIVPASANAAAVTITVSGVGSYSATYPDGTALDADELFPGRQTVFVFQNGRFELLFGSAATIRSEAAADRAEAAASGVNLPAAIASTMLVQAPDTSGYEALEAPSVRRFLGSGNTLYYFDFVPRGLRDDIASGVDNTTDQAGYWQDFRDALQGVATAGQKPHGVIPQCKIYTSTAPNFAIPFLHLETQGCPEIIATAAVPGFRMDGTGMGGGGWGLFGLEIGSLKAGTTTGAYGIDIRYIHQSEFDQLFSLGATARGINLSFLVSSILRNPTCSVSPIGGAYLTEPGYGIWLGADPEDVQGYASGWTTLINPIGEHVANGIVIDRANGTCVICGVAESCSSIGMTITEHAIYTNLYGTDFEANGSFDIYNSGFHGTFYGVHSEGRVMFTDNAPNNLISGGVYNKIDLDANTANNTIRDVFYASQAGGYITDLGTGNRVINCWDHQTSKNYSEWKTVSGLAVSATTGSVTATAVGRFMLDGRTVHFTVEISVSSTGTGAGNLRVTLPYAADGSRYYAFGGVEIANTGDVMTGLLPPGSAVLQIRQANGAWPAANGDNIVISGTFERA